MWCFSLGEQKQRPFLPDWLSFHITWLPEDDVKSCQHLLSVTVQRKENIKWSCDMKPEQHYSRSTVLVHGYRGNGVNSLMMPSAPSVMPWTMKVLPIPFHRAFGPWKAMTDYWSLIWSFITGSYYSYISLTNIDSYVNIKLCSCSQFIECT